MVAKAFGKKLLRLVEAPAIHEENGFPVELGFARSAGKARQVRKKEQEGERRSRHGAAS
jgi:hypothetical protein